MLRKSIVGMLIMMTLWVAAAHAEKRPKRWQLESDTSTIPMSNINIGLTEIETFGSIDLGVRGGFLFANSSNMSTTLLLVGLVVGPATDGPMHFQVTVGAANPYVKLDNVVQRTSMEFYGEARLAYDVGERFGIYGGGRTISDWSGVFLGIQFMTGSGGGGDEKDDEDDDDIGARARRALEEGR